MVFTDIKCYLKLLAQIILMKLKRLRIVKRHHQIHKVTGPQFLGCIYQMRIK